MESEILRQLLEAYPTAEAQRARLTEIINTFGSLSDSAVKFAVGDILCLAKLLYESGDKRVVLSIRRQALDLELAHAEEYPYVENL